MAMQAESLEVLEKAAVVPAQARAIVRAIEIEIACAKDTLAARPELLALWQECEAMRTERKAAIRAGARHIVRFMYLAMLGQFAVLSVFAYCLTLR
jgi:hypothetical protein